LKEYIPLYGDGLLHNVGTGDGIVQAIPEHYGRRIAAHAESKNNIPKIPWHR
jgi:hypothetical protein